MRGWAARPHPAVAGACAPAPAFGTISAVRIDLSIMLGAFLLASGLAAALGAANLGTALTFGQIAFALAAVLVIVRRP